MDVSMDSAAGGDLLVRREGAVLRLTLNRPQRRNAVTDALLRGLRDAVKAASEDDSVHVIVLTGEGDKAFCAGADLTPGDTPFKPDYARLQTPLGELSRAVHNCRIPIVGRINGLCMAGGMGLFGLCDMAVAVDTAKFGLPEVKIGIFPMQILTTLRDLIPPRMLNEMCMTGRPIDAATAFRLGLLNRVVPFAELDHAVEGLIAELLAVSPIALRRGKYAMRAVESMDFHQMMAFTESAIPSMIQTEDAREGLAAFNERRTPQWRGR
ncbi:enoyl-CoA hydratase-related protein [Variovorax ureilyticus]|uniref:Enoyl-CoA hydratase-related protein n=1 Tax=Variovorax ureilyticus TaxID=1836198 RepID=A0ABU8VLU9_9BURK